LIDGNFPKSVIDGVAETNKIENIALTRIVQFSEKEKKDIKGDIKFIQTKMVIVTHVLQCLQFV
jgi:hypothetical protein